MSDKPWKVKAYSFEYVGSKQKLRQNKFPAEFANRRKARQFCRNRRHLYEYMDIVAPDGTMERFNWSGY